MKAVVEIFDSSVDLEKIIESTLNANIIAKDIGISIQAIIDARQITAEMVIGNIIKGDDGKSAYQAALEGGYIGSESTFNYTLSKQQIVENISGFSVSLDLLGGHIYLCGELTSLTILSVENSTHEAIIHFTTGTVAPVFNFPASLGISGDHRPRALSSCEMNICFGEAIINWRSL